MAQGLAEAPVGVLVLVGRGRCGEERGAGWVRLLCRGTGAAFVEDGERAACALARDVTSWILERPDS
jgi:hypothetical protein